MSLGTTHALWEKNAVSTEEDAMEAMYPLVTRREEAYAIPVALLALAIGAFPRDVLGDTIWINNLLGVKCMSISSPSHRDSLPRVSRVWRELITHDAWPGGVAADLCEDDVAHVVGLLLCLRLRAFFAHFRAGVDASEEEVWDKESGG